MVRSCDITGTHEIEIRSIKNSLGLLGDFLSFGDLLHFLRSLLRVQFNQTFQYFNLRLLWYRYLLTFISFKLLLLLRECSLDLSGCYLLWRCCNFSLIIGIHFDSGNHPSAHMSAL